MNSLSPTLSLQIFLPEPECATGKAVVILPGGGYHKLSTGNEGTAWAEWFTQMGIAIAVVSYRLPYGNREFPLSDAYDAMRYMRANAGKLNISQDKIGIMGFSAGGHLASVVATQAPEDIRPNFQILFYPVISMMPDLTHKASHDNFLGAGPSTALERQFSSDLQVDSLTPPAIILLSADDRSVNPANSLAYFTALISKGISASLHIYPTGGHGWGFASCPWKTEMLAELASWLAR